MIPFIHTFIININNINGIIFYNLFYLNHYRIIYRICNFDKYCEFISFYKTDILEIIKKLLKNNPKWITFEIKIPILIMDIFLKLHSRFFK